ncbi:MAG TPA: hypothetical protein VD770_01610 [Coxiellaceae bacterium]|nr:hypothetical protein [Coxiellaceae bacterium]
MLLGNKHKNYYNHNLDRFVSTLVMLIAIPISLSNFLLGEGELLNRLALMFGQLFTVIILSGLSGKFFNHLNKRVNSSTAENSTAIVSSLLSIALPDFGTHDQFSRIEQKVVAKFAFWLSLPVLAGLGLKYAIGVAPQQLYSNLDLLIKVLVISLFMQVVIKFMESHTRHYRIGKLTTYFRILLGIILSSIVIMGL